MVKMSNAEASSKYYNKIYRLQVLYPENWQEVLDEIKESKSWQEKYERIVAKIIEREV